MNPEVKKKWVAALRSGDYEQGTRFLRSHDGFCCLGVLCDLHAKETNRAWRPMDGVAYYFKEYLRLPQEVADWAGLPAANPQLPGGFTLAYLNDVSLNTFEQIANEIEVGL